MFLTPCSIAGTRLGILCNPNPLAMQRKMATLVRESVDTGFTESPLNGL